MNIFCFLFFSLSSLITMKLMSMMILITAIYCVFILCFYCVLGPVLNMFNLHKNTCWCQIGHLSSKCHIAQVRNLRLRLCNLPNTHKKMMDLGQKSTYATPYPGSEQVNRNTIKRKDSIPWYGWITLWLSVSCC